MRWQSYIFLSIYIVLCYCLKGFCEPDSIEHVADKHALYSLIETLSLFLLPYIVSPYNKVNH